MTMNFIKQEAVNLQSKEASHTWEGAGAIAEGADSILC